MDTADHDDLVPRIKKKMAGKAMGLRARERMDKRASGGKWIAGAVKHPGALHRALNVPEGDKIPAAKMAKASNSENPRVRRMAGLAHTLKGLNK